MNLSAPRNHNKRVRFDGGNVVYCARCRWSARFSDRFQRDSLFAEHDCGLRATTE